VNFLSFFFYRKADLYGSITAADPQKGFWVQSDYEEFPTVSIL
jgi:hypothetical protein